MFCKPPVGLSWCPPALPVPLPGIELHAWTRARPRRVCQSPSSHAWSTLEIIMPKHFDSALCSPLPASIPALRYPWKMLAVAVGQALLPAPPGAGWFKLTLQAMLCLIFF